jgi:hypothetical protein
MLWLLSTAQAAAGTTKIAVHIGYEHGGRMSAMVTDRSALLYRTCERNAEFVLGAAVSSALVRRTDQSVLSSRHRLVGIAVLKATSGWLPRSNG